MAWEKSAWANSLGVAAPNSAAEVPGGPKSMPVSARRIFACPTVGLDTGAGLLDGLLGEPNGPTEETPNWAAAAWISDRFMLGLATAATTLGASQLGALMAALARAEVSWPAIDWPSSTAVSVGPTME